MHTLEIKLPDNVDVDQQEVMWDVAVLLYNQRKVSLGQAAEIVGVSKRTFMEMMGRRGGMAFAGTEEEVSRDFKNA